MHHTQKLEMGRKVRASLILAEVERRNAAGASIETVQPVQLRSLLLTLVNAVNEGRFWHGVPTLAAWSEMPKRSVQRCMAILIAIGIVEAEARSRAQGSIRKDRTTIYRLRWDELEKYCIEDGTGARAAPVRRREVAEPLFANERQRGACSADEQAPARRTIEVERAPVGARTGASGAAQVVESAETCGTESVDLNRFNPPQPPNAFDGPIETGGGGAVEPGPIEPEIAAAPVIANARTLGNHPAIPGERCRDGGYTPEAIAIVDAYPATNADVRTLDLDAALTAIAGERYREDGYTAAEILAAAQALAKDPPKRPLWCRTWLKNRGYEAHAKARRRADAAAAEGRMRLVRASTDRRTQDELLHAEMRRVNEALAALGPAELDALEAEAIANQPLAMTLAIWRKAGRAGSASLRAAMVALLDRRKAVA